MPAFDWSLVEEFVFSTSFVHNNISKLKKKFLAELVVSDGKLGIIWSKIFFVTLYV